MPNMTFTHTIALEVGEADTDTLMRVNVELDISGTTGSFSRAINHDFGLDGITVHHLKEWPLSRVVDRDTWQALARLWWSQNGAKVIDYCLENAGVDAEGMSA